MRTLFATCVVGLFVVGSANGQIRIFFDFEGVGEQEDRGAVDPLSYDNPVVNGTAGPVRLYIYGEFLSENALWLALNFDITAVGDAMLSNPTMYNHRTEHGLRWSARGSALNSPTNASFRSAWIGNPSKAAGGIWNWPGAEIDDPRHFRRDWDSGPDADGTTLLGYVDVEGNDGSLWMTTESPGFFRLGGGSQDPVYFGYGDGPVPPGGGRTAIAEATVVPEPAGLMLLGLAALVMRRRR